MKQIKKYVLFFVLGLAICCKSIFIDNNLQGVYTKKYESVNGFSQKISLRLERNGTFMLSETWFEGKSECIGRWGFITKDSISLKCNEDTSVLSHISAGYMSQRQRTAKVINKRQILIGNSVLVKE